MSSLVCLPFAEWRGERTGFRQLGGVGIALEQRCGLSPLRKQGFLQDSEEVWGSVILLGMIVSASQFLVDVLLVNIQSCCVVA